MVVSSFQFSPPFPSYLPHTHPGNKTGEGREESFLGGAVVQSKLEKHTMCKRANLTSSRSGILAEVGL